MANRHPDCEHCKMEIEYVKERARAIGKQLIGTQESLFTYLGDADEWMEDDQDFCDELSTVAEECLNCGLWSVPEEVDLDNSMCDQCEPDYNEEDEDETAEDDTDDPEEDNGA